MRFIFKNIIALFFIFSFTPVYAFNGLGSGDDLVAEAEDVPSAVEIVKTVLEVQGFSIEIVVNHQAAAASVGLELRPTQVIFARPSKRVERSLLFRSSTMGLDMPVKILVYEDIEGTIRLTFNSVGYLFDRHDPYVSDRTLRSLQRSLTSIGEVEGGVVNIESNQSFEDTVNTLLSELASRGFRVPLILDYNESKLDSHHPHNWRLPTLIVFGNPNVGTPLMQEKQTIAIDLPQKFLIWKNRSGGVSISYNDPAFFAERHGVVGQDARIRAIVNALAAIAAIGAGI